MRGEQLKRNGKMEAALAELRKRPELSVSQAAREGNVNRRTLQDRWSLEKPVERELTDPTGVELLEQCGLDPEDWAVKSIAASAVQGGDDPTLKVTAVPRVTLDLAAVPRLALTKPRPPVTGDRSVVICGDPHAPHQDPALNEALLSFLSDEQPDFIGITGDGGDYTSVSTHPASEAYRQDVRACNQAVHDWAAGLRYEAPDAEMVMMTGNHDARIELYIERQAAALLGVPAANEDAPIYDLRRLWDLDSLNIELVDNWKTGSYRITPSLTMRHGYLTTKNAGNQMLDKHGRSSVQGHDHRLWVVFKTKHDPLDIRAAFSAGTLATVDADGLGYAPEPDWQPGILVGHTWADGDFALAPAPFVHGKLLLPDGRRYG